MLARWIPMVFVLAACGGGGAPDILGLTDQVAVVGQLFALEIEGVDPDGDDLSYEVSSDLPLDYATMTRRPSGMGLFRWTPIATDVGSHTLDFTVSDGANETTVSVNVDVRSA